MTTFRKLTIQERLLLFERLAEGAAWGYPSSYAARCRRILTRLCPSKRAA